MSNTPPSATDILARMQDIAARRGADHAVDVAINTMAAAMGILQELKGAQFACTVTGSIYIESIRHLPKKRAR